MGQITIYIEDGLEKKMKEVAESECLSRSKWVAKLIEERLRDEWPRAMAAPAGIWKGLLAAEEIRALLEKDLQWETL